jgi:hypothetical protein
MPLVALDAIIVLLWGARVTEAVEPFDAPKRIAEAEDLAKLPCDQFSPDNVVNYYIEQLE